VGGAGGGGCVDVPLCVSRQSCDSGGFGSGVEAVGGRRVLSCDMSDALCIRRV
jgi:hypothetical protein